MNSLDTELLSVAAVIIAGSIWGTFALGAALRHRRYQPAVLICALWGLLLLVGQFMLQSHSTAFPNDAPIEVLSHDHCRTAAVPAALP